MKSGKCTWATEGAGACRSVRGERYSRGFQQHRYKDVSRALWPDRMQTQSYNSQHSSTCHPAQDFFPEWLESCAVLLNSAWCPPSGSRPACQKKPKPAWRKEIAGLHKWVCVCTTARRGSVHSSSLRVFLDKAIHRSVWF